MLIYTARDRPAARSTPPAPRPAPPAVALLEPPGFMMRNYGLRTPLVSLTAHVADGTIVGGFISLAGQR